MINVMIFLLNICFEFIVYNYFKVWGIWFFGIWWFFFIWMNCIYIFVVFLVYLIGLDMWGFCINLIGNWSRLLVIIYKWIWKNKKVLFCYKKMFIKEYFWLNLFFYDKINLIFNNVCCWCWYWINKFFFY